MANRSNVFKKRTPDSLRRFLRSLCFLTPVLFAGQILSAQVAVPSPNEDSAPYNALVLEAIAAMPKGGGFSVGKQAMANFKGSVAVDSSRGETVLKVVPKGAQPSFCSEATYLVFLKVVARLGEDKQLDLNPVELQQLLVAGQADGVGVWGRWNANGPGTARLFYELDVGENFSDLSRARAGDFLKVWWNEEIGQKEKGHSVIFLKTIDSPQGPAIRYWSSNLDGGYGEKEMPLSKIPRLLFSRFSKPQGLKNIGALPDKDDYLASMLKTASTGKQMCEMVGMRPAEDIVRPLPKAADPKKATPAPVNQSEARR